MGYTSVFSFVGGVPEWMHFGYPMEYNPKWEHIEFGKIPPQEVQDILDVRPEDFERDRTFIKGSVHCPLVYLAERCGDIPQGRPILITDWAMKQSPTAAKFLISKGHSVLGVLKGGLERWKAEGIVTEERVPDTTADP